MEGLYGWLRNITCYLLFMSVIGNLLPGKKYAKYLKLFAGMVLILLVVQPLTGSMRLENKIARYYEAFVFRDQADDLKREILGVEDDRLAQMISQYEEAVEQDVSQMVRDAGMTPLECRATIGAEEKSESFGTVTGIKLTAAPGVSADSTDPDHRAGQKPQIAPVDPVAPISIGEPQTVAPDGADPTDEEGRARREKTREEAGKLRRKIASYYNLEEAYVEVQILERER